MFILCGTIGAVIISIIEMIAFCRNRKALNYLHTVIKNIFLINLISLAILKYVFKYAHFINTDKYQTESFVKFFFLSLIVGAALLLIHAFVNRYLTFEEETASKKPGAIFMKVLSAVFCILGCAAFFGSIYAKGSYGDVAPDELFITLFSPTAGTDPGVYTEIIEGPVFQTMLVSAIIFIFIFSNFKITYHTMDNVEKTVFNDLWHRITSLVLSFAMLAGGIAYGVTRLELVKVFRAYAMHSDIIEENYVNPKTAEIIFPERKRNLIHIYLESMENSYLSKDLGGYMEQNLMPELTKLSYEGITFSNNDTKFGEPLEAPGTTWSVASMVNMTTGLPMKVPTKPNAYGSKDNFLPGAYTMGDILKAQGYNQTVMFGADANFGGLSYYYQSHGDYKIMDYNYAKRNGLIPQDYKVWWGYEDDKLYEYAKNELTRLSETGKPFNLTMETADTHRPGGYLSKNAPTPYSDHYANAIAYSTSETVKFVRWIQKQPFYENTTIVLIGDHLSMDTDFFKNFDSDYLRIQYNLILNPAPDVANVNKKISC
ncbi:MAG: LTA synthase family protein [Clostridiales bacterium]|nr:LTA synthase family protein [Clostridiales bacterium]